MTCFKKSNQNYIEKVIHDKSDVEISLSFKEPIAVILDSTKQATGNP